MKALYKSLIILLLIFFLILIFGRLHLSLSEGWYKEIYPDRFTVSTSAALFFILTVLAAVSVLLLSRACHKRISNLPDKRNLSKRNIYLILIGIIILKIVIFYVFYVDAQVEADYKTYYLVADALSKGEILLPKYIAVFPHVFGYPYILSVLFRLFGSSVMTGSYFNLILSILIIWLIFFIGRELLNERLGLIASFMYAIMPSSTMYCYLMCSEFVFQAFFLAIVLIFIYLLKVENNKKFFMLSFINGILIGLLSSVRPNGVILLIALLIMIILFIRKFDVKITNKILIPCLCATYVISYFLASNLTKAFIENKIGTQIADNRFGWNLYVGLNTDSLGTWNYADSQLFAKILREKGPNNAQSELFDLAIERLRQFDTPSKTISFLYHKTMKMWSHDHEVFGYIEGAVEGPKPWWMENLSRYKIIRLISDGIYYSLLIIAATGFIYLLIKDKKINMLLMIFILFFLGTVALHLPFEAAPRYHNPCLAPLCIIAAYCVVNMGTCRMNNEASDNSQ